jgi:hypothetical protein
MLGKVRIDPPVAHSVGIGHRIAGDAWTAEAQMVELGRLCAQAGFNVPQTFTPRQLRKSETTKLIET